MGMKREHRMVIKKTNKYTDFMQNLCYNGIAFKDDSYRPGHSAVLYTNVWFLTLFFGIYWTFDA